MSDNKILVGDMSRKQCLEVLKKLLEAMETFDGISPSPERINALKMAISSLETDEAYQLEYERTTKNDLPHCQHTDEEIAKSFIEDVETVKDQLPCGEQMDFPNTFDEFAKDYGFKDKEEVYTNGSELIPVFRVKQWLEHISTTKNDLGVDKFDKAINQSDLEEWIMGTFPDWCVGDVRLIMNHMDEMPPVTPIRPKGYWIVQPSNKEQGERDFIWWKCSECGQVIFSETEHDRLEFHAFCGRCGSDNREVVEE